MQRCNPPRFKTYRRTKGSGNRAIPYFEGFTTAAISWNQSERSLFYGTKNEWSVIATLQKPVAWLRFLFFQFRGRGVCFIAGDVKRGGRGIQGAWKGSAGVALWRPHCRQFATESMQAIFLLLGGREAAHGQIRGFIGAGLKRGICR